MTALLSCVWELWKGVAINIALLTERYTELRRVELAF